MTFFLFLEFCVIYFNFFMKIFEYFTIISMSIKKWLAKMCLKKLCIMNSLTFAIHIYWYHLMQINLLMIILGQMIVFCKWFHWKFNHFTQKISTFIHICFEKLFALFASICLRTILFAEKCKQFLFANDLQSVNMNDTITDML